MKADLLKFRLKIDLLCQLTVNIFKTKEDEAVNRDANKFNYPKHVETTIDNLYLAKAWVGSWLGEIAPTPYINDGKRKQISDISMPSEVSDVDYSTFETKNYIERLDYLREEIKKVLSEIMMWYASLQVTTVNMTMMKGFVFQYLSEARFALGFELSKLRDQQTKELEKNKNVTESKK